MLKHLFKLIWNRKRRNLLMILEIFISFIVMFVVVITVIFLLGNYLKPLGFNYKNVWMVNIDWQNAEKTSIVETLKQLETAVAAFPEVTGHAFSESYLFTPAAMSGDNLEYNGNKVSTSLLRGDDQFAKVLDIQLAEGRWFGPEDNTSLKDPIIINRNLEKELFRGESGLGKTVLNEDEENVVVGIVDDIRNSGELTRSKKILVRRINLDQSIDDISFLSENFGKRLLIKTRPGTDAQFEERFLKNLSSVAKDFRLKTVSMEEARINANKQSMIFPIILLIVSGFLIINVSLGLFGVIWYNTNKRRAEIGLRRALGSTAKGIYIQILSESLVLSTFGIILGGILAIQIPILNVVSFIETNVYTLAFILSILFIYVITSICALYPGKIAAGIQPATALHEE